VGELCDDIVRIPMAAGVDSLNLAVATSILLFVSKNEVIPIIQHCPICGVEVQPNVRYRNYLCVDCCLRAADEKGRPLEFDLESATGGLIVRWKDTKERRESPMCWVDGQQCEAREAHMGGYVLLPFPSEYHRGYSDTNI
jgi:hypothetical protein